MPLSFAPRITPILFGKIYCAEPPTCEDLDSAVALLAER